MGDRDGSTATRSSSMTLKLVNGGVPATGREAVAELARGVHIFVRRREVDFSFRVTASLTFPQI